MKDMNSGQMNFQDVSDVMPVVIYAQHVAV